MITYSPAMSHWQLNAQISLAVSPVAANLRAIAEDYSNHYQEPRAELLVPQIQNLSSTLDDDTCVPVTSQTIQAAIQFAYCLPRFGPLPEISADPDGEISFEWISPSDRMFSVSISAQSRLAYAGWFGKESRVHGTEYLGESCPESIIQGICRATGC